MGQSSSPFPRRQGNKPKRRVPLGKAIIRTDEELEALAQITPEDIEQAGALWKSSVTGPLKTLLDAQPGQREAEDGRASTPQ